MLTKRKTIVTHNGQFHADDLFACAFLTLYFKQQDIVPIIKRTRDKEEIQKGDVVVDVGGLYDPERMRFDHHQATGAGTHANNIPLASLGLIWKHFGQTICEYDKELFAEVEKRLIIPIDAIDNGFDIAKPLYDSFMPMGIDQAFLMYSPTWQEGEDHIDKIFVEQVSRVTEFLERMLEVYKTDLIGKKSIIDSYEKSSDKQIIELTGNFPRYLYQETLSRYPEPVYVIYPGAYVDHYKVEAIKKDPETFESRKPFPLAWREKVDNSDALSKITGISDIIFCHKSGFLLTVKTKEGAYALAELALKS